MKRLVLFFLLLLLLLSACTPAPAVPTPIPIPPENTPTSVAPPEATHTPQATATPTSKPTLFLPPNPTPYPTLYPDEARQLFNTMQDESCKLPCFLGIVPGETLMQDAREILLRLGGAYLGEYIRKTDGAVNYSFKFKIGDQNSGETLITHTVTLIPDNEIVQAIIVGGGTLVPKASPEAIKTYRTYWQRYSASSIFFQLGEPDGISVMRIEGDFHYGTDLILLYERVHIAIHLYGTGQENNLCQKNEATFITLDMYLSCPESTVDIYAGGRVPLTDQEIYPPIEEVYGVSARQFYYSVNSDPSVCWAPKEESLN